MSLIESRPNKRLRSLFCLVVSAKRYVLFNLDREKPAGDPKGFGPWLGPFVSAV